MKTPFRWLLLSILMFSGGVSAPALDIEWTEISANSGGSRATLLLSSGTILGTRDLFQENEHRVVCSQSLDHGRTWKPLSIIARQTGCATVGDGHFLQLPSGAILYSYRHNLFGDSPDQIRQYAIRVAISHDDGKTWQPHSTVATSTHDPRAEPDAQRGLWSSFLLLTRDGKLHCIYDDENTPHRRGFPRHQWLTMKTWDPATGNWKNPVTVARAHDPTHLSRSGMPSAIELPAGRLLCAFEDVRPNPPHANLIQFVTSDDGGKTWSWTTRPREILHESPEKPNNLSLSPSLLRLKSGEILCVFATDEDREIPGISGTPPRQLHLDIKWTATTDNGQTWTRPANILSNQTHRAYLPALLQLPDDALLATFHDFSTGQARAFHGKILP